MAILALNPRFYLPLWGRPGSCSIQQSLFVQQTASCKLIPRDTRLFVQLQRMNSRCCASLAVQHFLALLAVGARLLQQKWYPESFRVLTSTNLDPSILLE